MQLVAWPILWPGNVSCNTGIYFLIVMYASIFHLQLPTQQHLTTMASPLELSFHALLVSYNMLLSPDACLSVASMIGS
jgi:hypothetical protein